MIKIENITSNIVNITVPPTLKEDDFSHIATKADALIKKHKKIRLVIDASKFNGWDNLKALEKHMAFVKSHHNKVERIAVIAAHTWQHWVVGTLKIFIHPEIKMFDKGEDAAALEWVGEEGE